MCGAKLSSVVSMLVLPRLSIEVIEFFFFGIIYCGYYVGSFVQGQTACSTLEAFIVDAGMETMCT